MREEKVVRGSVIENNLGCHVDARCFLRLRLNEGQIPSQEILVIYHYGEWPACLNEEAADQGEKLQESDEIEVFGQYGEQGDKRVIVTCDSTNYYIRKIQR